VGNLQYFYWSTKSSWGESVCISMRPIFVIEPTLILCGNMSDKLLLVQMHLYDALASASKLFRNFFKKASVDADGNSLRSVTQVEYIHYLTVLVSGTQPRHDIEYTWTGNLPTSFTRLLLSPSTRQSWGPCESKIACACVAIWSVLGLTIGSQGLYLVCIWIYLFDRIRELQQME